MTMNDPLLRTDSYAKIFLYNTHETVACVPRHTIRMRDKVRPDKLREAVEQALLRFPHMMLTAEPTETAFRYRRNVQPAVALPFDGVSTATPSAPRIRTDTYFSSATTTRPSIWSISTLSRMDADSRSLSAVYCSST